ncbi:UNVERIFIED_CONTAM: hypothetical protein Scaly_2920200 [Sesamum calycinum]|uniref:Retrotransposon Copia-like N-terminal domain-containing protein n=1 Tax=Sesamum calycinum TaxID=2727403 RepID=A0AAW2KYP6_9LAMI
MARDSENLKIQPSDNSGMGLVSNPLNGRNFLSWSRSIKIMLGAKMKLGFINGKIPKPAEDDEELEQWIRADCMVTSWLLNSISKDIVESYLYASIARELWEELEAIFRESNGPQIYQIRREIASVVQGNLSISAYFSKIKRLWDELACLVPTATCSCGASREIAESTIQDQLMQFLMGLDDCYDQVHNQILMMELLPSISKAYSMILRVEKQREVSAGLSTAIQNMAMQVRGGDTKKTGNFRNFQKRKGILDKKNLVCEHCGKTGHGKDTYFDIHGVLEWYRTLMEHRRKIGASTSKAFNTLQNQEATEELAQNALDENTISELVRAELRRYME